MTDFVRLAIFIMIFSLAGCGGGGETGSSATTGKVVAVMKSTALSPAAASVGAISCTLSLPYGVFAKTDAAGNVVVAEVVQVINSSLPVGTIVSAPVYIAPTAAHSGSIQVAILNADGFNANEEVAINLLTKNSYVPKPDDFSLVGFTAWDLNGAIITLNPTLSVQSGNGAT